MPPPQTTLTIRWAQQTFTLTHQRAVYHAASQTLMVADLHLGKAEHFRASGIPVPAGVNDQTLERLTALTQEFPTRRLLVLGDFFHSRASQTPQLLDQLHHWRQQLAHCDITNIRGNHDRHAGDPHPRLGIGVEQEGWTPPEIESIKARHDTGEAHRGTAGEKGGETGWVVAGHVHPATVLQAGRERLRLPCYWIRPTALILPAFGSFTGCCIIKPCKADAVVAVTSQRLLLVPGHEIPEQVFHATGPGEER